MQIKIKSKSYLIPLFSLASCASLIFRILKSNLLWTIAGVNCINIITEGGGWPVAWQGGGRACPYQQRGGARAMLRPGLDLPAVPEEERPRLHPGPAGPAAEEDGRAEPAAALRLRQLVPARHQIHQRLELASKPSNTNTRGGRGNRATYLVTALLAARVSVSWYWNPGGSPTTPLLPTNWQFAPASSSQGNSNTEQINNLVLRSC